MIDTMKITVTTPTLTPRMVSAERSLFVRTVSSAYMTALFDAAAEATEEAILNALLAAETMTGRDGITAYGLDPELLLRAQRATEWDLAR